MAEDQKNYSILTIIITAIVVIIILLLAFLFYYFSTRPVPVVSEEPAAATPVKESEAPQVVPTNVINFISPETLPTEKKSGYCWVNSIAQPYRQDAWRCMVGNEIYDPCFETADKSVVFCQMNPLDSESFLIKLTKPLPEPDVPDTVQTNWAWFLELEDGTYCSPFTGTRPFFGNPPNVLVAYYGCKSDDKNEQIVLMDDLTIDGTVWTANKTILTKSGASWVIKSSEQVKVKTVWQ